MSSLALRLPRLHPQLFLVLAAAIWVGLYRLLAPASEILVGALPVDRFSHLGGGLMFLF